MMIKHLVKRFTVVALLIAFGLSGAYAQSQPIRNVIFMIGDGMGFAHVQAAKDRCQGTFNMYRATYTGMVTTHSANNRVTDSAAGGTAYSTGHKTKNGYIACDTTGKALPTILELAVAKGYAAGVVVTSRVTHATPACFVAHNADRAKEQDIALDFLNSNIDVFLGSGKDMFYKRDDKRNLLDELQAKGYQNVFTRSELAKVKKGRVAGLLSESTFKGMVEGRGDILPFMTKKGLELLKANSSKGFFVMVEGSQIDWSAHGNSGRDVVAEVLDFDKAVKEAFDFADKNPGTLVVITADHETGGMTLPYTEENEYLFSTGNHSGAMVPLFAYGTGAENFKGVMDNTDVHKILKRIWGL